MRTLLAFALTLGVATTAFASVPTADDYARQAASAMGRKKFDDAAGQYLLAYLSDARPERLLDVARAYHGAKNKEVAIALYQLVEQQAGNSATGAVAHSALVQLGAVAPAPAPAQLQLTVMPPGAEVRIDGALVGKAPVGAVAIAAGVRRIDVSLAGYQTVTQEISAQPSQAVAMVVTLVPGASAAVTPPPGTAPPALTSPPVVAPPTVFTPPAAATAGLAGAWFGTRFSDAGRRDQQSLVLNLQGTGTQVAGEARLTTVSPLAKYRQAQCNNATELTTVTRYRVRYSGTAEGGQFLAESGSVQSCSCEGLCSASGDQTWDVVVSPRSTVMAGQAFFFQRLEGVTPPADTVRAIDPRGIAGTWTARLKGEDKPVKVTLSPDGQGVSGQAKQERSSKVQNWRRADCDGSDTVTATHNYGVSADPENGGLDLDFKHKGTENCSCKEGACAAAGASAGIDGGATFWTLDGNHLVAPGLLMVRD